MRAAIKDNPLIQPSQVIVATLHAAPAEMRAAIRNRETVRCWLRRQKRGVLPAKLTSLDHAEVPEKLRTMGENDDIPFLLYDSGPTVDKWTFVFALAEQLRDLAIADW